MAQSIKQVPLNNSLQYTLNSQYTSGGNTLVLNQSVAGVVQAPGVCVVDRINSSGAATPTTRTYYYFTGVSSSTLTGVSLADGTDQTHAVGAIVEFVPDVKWAQSIYDALSQVVVPSTGLINKAAGSDINTGTDDDKIVTSKAIADSYLSNNYNSLYRQALINGNFDIWQRSTSAATATAAPYISAADRWQSYRGGAATGATFSQQDGTGVVGSRYSCRVQRDSGNASTSAIWFGNTLENANSILLRGKKLTLSFWAKKGANYSAASDYLVANIGASTVADQTWAINAAAIDTSNVVLTTSWQKFTLTTANVIASDVNTVRVAFAFSPTGTASTNDWFEVTQVQLCAGDVALPFMPKSFGNEKNDSLRFAWQTGDITAAGAGSISMIAATTSLLVGYVKFPVSMRIAPTMAIYSGNQANHVRTTSTGADVAITPTAVTTVDGVVYVSSTGTPFTAGLAYDFHALFNSEL
jgi:hypothetical protein